MTKRFCRTTSKLEEFLWDPVPPAEALELNEHLSSCELCRSRRDEIEEVQRRLQADSNALGQYRYPGRLMDDIRAKLETKEAPHRSRKHWVGVAAAATVLLVLSLVFMPGSRRKDTTSFPSPFATSSDLPSPYATPPAAMGIPTPPDISRAFSMGTEALGGLRPPSLATISPKKEAQ